MTSIFEYENYKKLVRDWVEERPKGGHGQFKKMAEYLNVSTVLVSQIFNGDRDLTNDQAWVLTSFMGLTQLESEYFHLLVQRERAGVAALKDHLENKLKEVRARGQNLRERLPRDLELTEQDKALFYSNWYYSAARLLTSIQGYQNVDAIAARLELPRSQVAQVVEFLLSKGLCVESDRGELAMGPRRTHLEKESPYIRNRQLDWRSRGFEAMNRNDPHQMFFTGPMTLSVNGIEMVRQEILKLIDVVSKIVDKEQAQELACLNIDWFKV
jgi:uncharacterized protein (TIGR02147 family)